MAENDSLTAGMTLEERIKHVGGRENAAGYIEFGSVMAVAALVKQVLRDLPEQPPKNIRVHGWVWKDKQTEDDCYIPSYTPAQHVSKGELLALVDPADLHEPLQNTKWF